MQHEAALLKAFRSLTPEYKLTLLQAAKHYADNAPKKSLVNLRLVSVANDQVIGGLNPVSRLGS